MAAAGRIAPNRTTHRPRVRAALEATKIMRPTVAFAAPHALRRWPARLDALQSGTGLLLALFLVLHSAFVGTLLFGPAAFESVLRLTDGTLVFGRSMPALHAILATTIALLVVVHAALALRRFPEGYREHRAFRQHARAMRHAETTLWYWQVVTGFLMFFLVSVHLYTMITQPDRIGPFESAARIVQGRMWLLYLLLTPIAQFHSLVGLYRLSFKWGWVSADDPARARKQLRRLLWPVMALFIVVGLATLASEVRVGLERSGWRPAPAAAAIVEGTPS